VLWPGLLPQRACPHASRRRAARRRAAAHGALPPKPMIRVGPTPRACASRRWWRTWTGTWPRPRWTTTRSARPRSPRAATPPCGTLAGAVLARARGAPARRPGGHAAPRGRSRSPPRLRKPGKRAAVLAEGPPETPDHCVHGWQSRARHAQPYAPPQLKGRSRTPNPSPLREPRQARGAGRGARGGRAAASARAAGGGGGGRAAARARGRGRALCAGPAGASTGLAARPALAHRRARGRRVRRRGAAGHVEIAGQQLP